MDRKKLIKTLINVLPIVIVPLVTERKHIKEHLDVQKVTNVTPKATLKATSATSNKASDVKGYVGDKKQESGNKHGLKKIARKNDPAYIEKKGERLAKQSRKEADKMDKKLQKNIEKRHKEEQKQYEANQKQRVKDMKKIQKHEEQVGLAPGKIDHEIKKEGEKLEKDNREDIKKLNKKLQRNIEKRHREGQKQCEEAEKAREEEFEKYENYVADSVVEQHKESDHF